MIEQLTELLHRQAAAAELVERRLRVLELLEASGETRFVAPALDDLERASERLAALELGRTIAIVSAGLPADATAADLAPLAEEAEVGPRFAAATARLRGAAARVEAARDRTRTVVEGGAERTGARLALAAAG